MEYNLVILLAFCILSSSGVSAQASETAVLNRFKESLEKQSEELPELFSSWKSSDASPCKWDGITCDSKSGLVEEIDLFNAGIYGEQGVPEMVCELPGLKVLKLGSNNFGGRFPEHLLNCKSLESLDLSMNLFVDVLPSNISALAPTLKHLDLCGNNFTGELPEGLGKLGNLLTLNLTNNLLNGTLPGFLGDLSSLQRLDLAWNKPMAAGPIPEELGKLRNLRNLLLTGMNLIGPIPESLGNLQELDEMLDLSQNQLQGPIPASIFNLPKLKMLELYDNELTGEIPSNIFNLTSATDVDLSTNNLTGGIPSGVAQLKNLQLLHLFQNDLSGPIPQGIGDLEELFQVRAFKNNLSGRLPQKLGMNKKMLVFDVSDNQLEGPLPAGLCDSGRLQELIFFNNRIDGPIPESYASCTTLQRVLMSNNMLTGIIPPGLWSIGNAYIVEMRNNRLNGSITSDVSKIWNITTLDVSGNQLSGRIPLEIGRLARLTKLSMQGNRFEGPIPSDLGSLSNLSLLNLGSNRLSGEIPEELGRCNDLSQLDLSKNKLTGSIPRSLGDIGVLTSLDLSTNLLTGEIPSSIGNIKFSNFNVSDNPGLSGEVPEGLSNGAFETSFLGNPRLCSSSSTYEMIRVNRCSGEGGDGVSGSRLIGFIIGGTFAAAALVFLVGSCLFFRKYKQHLRRNIGRKSWSLTSFHRLPFNQLEVIDSLDEDNVIGSGGAGKVYLSKLSNGQAVAVKKLWIAVKKGEEESVQQRNYDRSFKAEVETLGKLRHKNIVKLLFCYSCDEEKFLVYDYMENGSLGDLLHSSKGSLVLSWPTRHRIALGAAEGLSYLHHDYKPQVLHCDVKSNNILLDADFEPHVADFGLARIIQGFGNGASMTSIAGTYGYIAPEYAYSLKVTEKSDIYSFGVVLLELVTGKRPIEPEFGDGVDIVKWVCDKIQARNSLVEIFDTRIPACYHEDMMLVLRVGLLCTSILPVQRPSMKEVVQMLVEAKPKEKSSSKLPKDL